MPKDRWEQFNEIADNTELTGNEKLLMILIFRYYSPKHGYSYPTIETLKQKMGYSHTRYVVKNIKSLVDKGYIRKETVKQSNRYYILTTSDVQNIPRVQNVPNVQSVPFDDVQNVPTAKVQNVPTKRKIKENIKENIYSDLIKNYPGKKIKAVRDKKLPKILKEYSIEEIERCITRYAEECKGRDKKFILNESTFWNGRYVDYLDENFEEIIATKEVKEENTGRRTILYDANEY